MYFLELMSHMERAQATLGSATPHQVVLCCVRSQAEQAMGIASK